MKDTITRRASCAAVVAIVLLVAIACARVSKESGNDNSSQAFDETPVALLVQNHNFSDMNVYAVPTAGAAYRIGTVTGESSEAFKIPGSYIQAGAIGFRAVPIGGFGQVGTGRVLVSPGDTLVWTIEQALRQSSVTIR